MKIIEFGPNEFQNGALFDDNAEGVGLSPLYKGHNYFKGKGAVMYPCPSATAITVSGGTLAEMVASCLDPAYLGNDGYFVDASGQFWALSGTTLTYKQIDDTSGHVYGFGNVDIKVFNGEIFATCDDDIIKLTNNMAAIDKTWWTVTKSKSGLQASYRHPMEIVEDTLYIADQYRLHTFDTAGTATYEWLLLPASVNITAMIKHPNGRYLMAFAAETANYSHTKKSKAKLFIIDTTTGEFIQEIKIDDQVEGAINIGGIIHVTYGDTFGYFNGQGLKPLKKIDYYSTPIYTPRLASMGNVALFPEYKSNAKWITAYGDVNGKGNILFYPFYDYDAVAGVELKNILAVAPQALIINYRYGGATWYMKKLDFTASTNYVATVLSGKRNLGGRHWIRRVDLFTETAVSGSTMIAVAIELGGGAKTIGTIDYSVDGGVAYKRLDCNVLVSDLQFAITWNGANAVGLKKALIYVEPE